MSSLETTVKKIEEIISLLEMFASKRKPLVKRKFTYKDSTKTVIHIIVGYDEVGRYTLDKGKEDVYFKDMENMRLPMLHTTEYFYMEVKGRELDFRTLGAVKHLKHLNKYKGLSKPSKKDLEKLKYVNKAFIMTDGDFIELKGKEFPNKEDLMNQKVYLHVRDTCTNSMLMSKDFDIQPFNLNQLINEVVNMNPHLVRDLNIDYYEFEKDETNLKVGESRKIADAILRENAPTMGFRSYFTIKEALYASIVNNMSKAKDIEVAYKRESIASQYVESFISLKEHLSDAGYSSNDIEGLMQKRVSGSKLIKLITAKALMHVSSSNRYDAALFNHINHKLEMHAIKKDKDNNRTIRNGVLQSNVIWVEQKVIDILNTSLDKGIEANLAIGIAIAYIESLNLLKRECDTPRHFVKELMEENGIVNKLQKLINVNPYITNPIP